MTGNPSVLFRRRSSWEAADMGVFLWRTNLLPVVLFLGIPAAILGSVRFFLPKEGFEGILYAVVFMNWWLKPLLDRLCLQVAAVRFFEPRASFRRLFRGLGRTLMTGLAGDLLWRRFSLCRSARMPLLVLERLRGKSLERRKQLLGRNGLGFGFPLTIICAGCTTALEGGGMLFLYGIADMLGNAGGGFMDFFQNNIVFAILVLIDMLVIESLYVFMGFGLYINARVETEGWDIELLFKQCVEKAGGRRRSPAAAVMVLFLFLFAAPRIPAAEPETFKPAPLSEEERSFFEEVYNSSDFGSQEPYKQIRFKETKDIGRIRRNAPFELPGLRELLGLGLRALLGAAVLGALVFAAVYAYRNRERLPPLLRGKNRRRETEETEPPLRLLEEAAELHRRGKIREAWACCFRAFTAAFAGICFLSFPPEATEYETLALVRKSTAADAGFEVFVRRWINLAYGGKPPRAGDFEEALASCRSLLGAAL